MQELYHIHWPLVVVSLPSAELLVGKCAGYKNFLDNGVGTDVGELFTGVFYHRLMGGSGLVLGAYE